MGSVWVPQSAHGTGRDWSEGEMKSPPDSLDLEFEARNLKGARHEIPHFSLQVPAGDLPSPSVVAVGFSDNLFIHERGAPVLCNGYLL